MHIGCPHCNAATTETSGGSHCDTCNVTWRLDGPTTYEGDDPGVVEAVRRWNRSGEIEEELVLGWIAQLVCRGVAEA